jgi:uncharacterized membrane protein YcaP (DUF421 family)
MDWSMIFSDASSIVRTVMVGVLAYVTLVMLLRVSGKRTLSKMNAFDFVVTVAIGSTLATILLSSDVALAQGVAAFAVLIGMQFLVAWISVRSSTMSRLVKSEPRLLLHRGRPLRAAMRDERIVDSELHAALRERGIASVENVDELILETDGTFTVIADVGREDTALSDVAGYRADREGLHG